MLFLLSRLAGRWIDYNEWGLHNLGPWGLFYSVALDYRCCRSRFDLWFGLMLRSATLNKGRGIEDL